MSDDYEIRIAFTRSDLIAFLTAFIIYYAIFWAIFVFIFRVNNPHFPFVLSLFATLFFAWYLIIKGIETGESKIGEIVV